MKILFMGTPDFAVTSLMALKKACHDICCVITVPDKPKGRGHKLTHTPVYDAAIEIGAPVYTPENLKPESFEHILNTYTPDIIIVVAYGKILPGYVLEYPRYGCVNVHGSLLPKYRGAAPIQRSIIDGEKVTGITTMYMEKGLDTGDMLLKGEVTIEDDDNFESLHDKLAELGAELIVETVSLLEKNAITPQKQDDSQSCYAHMITKETCVIDWSKNATQIHNLIRGLCPFPKACTTLGGKQIKILRSKVSDTYNSAEIGTITAVNKDSFTVACGQNTSIDVFFIQCEGKKAMSVSDFLKGNSIGINTILGR